MMTDSDGFNSFFHVLIFYEEINEAEINSNDFDIFAEIFRKNHMMKKTLHKGVSGNYGNARDGSTGD
jgi:hypothetical protein